MKSNSSFTWEIVIAGILLTAVAIYFNKRSGHSTINTDYIEKVIKDHEIHFGTEKKQKDIIIINPGQFFNAKTLDSLKSSPNLDSLRDRIKYLKNEILQKTANDTNLQNQVKQSIDAALKNLSEVNQEQFSIDTQKNRIVIIPKQRSTVSNSISDILTKQFTANGVKKVHIKSPGGDITVEGNNDNIIDVNVTSGKKNVKQSDFKKYYEVKIFRDGSNVNVIIQKKGGLSFWKFLDDMSANVDIKVPTKMNLDGETAGGSVTIRHIDGAIKMSTLGGHILLSDAHGSLDLKTLGGAIKAEHLTGSLKAKTMGGSIHLNDSNGNIDVSTNGGDIEMKNIYGLITAYTMAGNITADLTRFTNDLSCKTNAGNISITVPKSASAKLNLSGSDVTVHKNLQVSGNVSKGKISGTLNNGGNKSIEAHTYAGNVTLTSK